MLCCAVLRRPSLFALTLSTIATGGLVGGHLFGQLRLIAGETTVHDMLKNDYPGVDPCTSRGLRNLTRFFLQGTYNVAPHEEQLRERRKVQAGRDALERSQSQQRAHSGHSHDQHGRCVKEEERREEKGMDRA
mmetsp:Transcript_9955/g.21749  ORF Transcript_9955/g.21749 Transcript_9955/m.21749 type:complete len:133 (+) Transcript_9955:311-709(+)